MKTVNKTYIIASIFFILSALFCVVAFEYDIAGIRHKFLVTQHFFAKQKTSLNKMIVFITSAPKRNIKEKDAKQRKSENIALPKAAVTPRDVVKGALQKKPLQDSGEEKKTSPTKIVDKRMEWLFAMRRCQGIHGINTTKKIIALTFDDGPNGRYSSEILDVLKAKNVRATFFVIGKNVLHHPDIVKRMHAENHVVGSHTFSHVSLASLDDDGVTLELQKNNAVLYKTVGVMPTLFRPPYGVCSVTSPQLVQKFGMKTIIWNDTTNDYDVGKTTAENIAAEVLRLAHPGGIITLHDGGGNRSKTAAALPAIITTLEKEGYRFLTVPELLSSQAYNMEVIERRIDFGHKKNFSEKTKPRFVNTLVLHFSNHAEEGWGDNLEEILQQYQQVNMAPHYTVLRDGSIYRLVPDDAVAWHVDKAKVLPSSSYVNSFSLGIDVVVNANTGHPTHQQYVALARLVKALRSLYPIGHIISYDQISTEKKEESLSFDWQRFNDDLAE